MKPGGKAWVKRGEEMGNRAGPQEIPWRGGWELNSSESRGRWEVGLSPAGSRPGEPLPTGWGLAWEGCLEEKPPGPARDVRNSPSAGDFQARVGQRASPAGVGADFPDPAPAGSKSPLRAQGMLLVLEGDTENGIPPPPTPSQPIFQLPLAERAGAGGGTVGPSPTGDNPGMTQG